ncbi:MAG: T9SS type A sorting domain-containing protein [Flavobacteriales bacterium]|nr:T9SS type A sorting domain-containing protein [Flavobacteriales bacterium]MBL4735177.1 T9SS type A sorting domain-containing protein [Flavobacteriales bacterium]
MKAHLFTLLLFIAATCTYAQTCTPDSQYVTSGFYPDSATGLPGAPAGQPYSTVITIVVPIDSLFDFGPPLGLMTVTFDSLNVQDNTGDGIALNGLPPGFTYVCNPPGCSFPGGTSGCLLIMGTPSIGDTGIYNLVIENDAYVLELVPSGNPPANMDPISYYSIEITDSVAMPPDTTCTVFDTIIVYDTVTTTVIDTITYYDTVLISVTDTLIIDVTLTGVNPPNNTNTIVVYPNPTNDQITIDNGDYLSMVGYTVKIVNSLGQDVFNSLVTTQQFVIDLNTFGSTGIYYLQVIDGNSTILENRKLVLE